MFLTPQQVLRVDQKGARAVNGRLLPQDARVRVLAVSPVTGEVRVKVDDAKTGSHGAIAVLPFDAVRTVSRGRPRRDGTPAGEGEEVTEDDERSGDDRRSGTDRREESD